MPIFGFSIAALISSIQLAIQGRLPRMCCHAVSEQVTF
jgi:hypothetical protein